MGDTGNNSIGTADNISKLSRGSSKTLFPTKALLTWVNGVPKMEQMNFLFPPKTVLTWINGIGFNMGHMNDGQINISSVFGNRPVLFCHNPTAMVNEDDTKGYIGDLTQATTQKFGKCTTEVDELVRHLKEAIKKVGPKGRVIHIAHSQGALITSLAVKRLTKQEMSQMEVICFGGAEAMECSETYPFARCINYYSVNDPLLFVVPSAARALRSGYMGMGGIKHHRQKTTGASSLAALVDPLAEPEFVFLTPRAGDPIEDHGLFGPTYIDALRWEGRRYITLYLPPWHPIIQFAVEKSNSLSDALTLVFKIILRHTLLPIIVFVMNTNVWIKENILVPIIVLFIKVWKKILEIVRIVRGEDVYEPVVVPPQEVQQSLVVPSSFSAIKIDAK